MSETNTHQYDVAIPGPSRLVDYTRGTATGSTCKWSLQLKIHSSKLEPLNPLTSIAAPDDVINYQEKTQLVKASDSSPTHTKQDTSQRENYNPYNQACFSASPNVTSVLGQKWLKSPTGKSMPNLISAAIITNVMYQLHGKNHVPCQRMILTVSLRAWVTLTLV
jgi:hypothetical protein